MVLSSTNSSSRSIRILFTVHVPEAVLDDLRARPPAPGGRAAAQTGPGDRRDAAYRGELVGYWTRSFDWRARECCLSAFPQSTAVVGGLLVHFIHQLGRGPRPFQLVLTHS